MSWVDITREHAKPSKPISVSSMLTMCTLSIAQLAVGAVYKDDCPRQPYIPIYLMVSGAFILVSSLSTVAGSASSGNLSKVCYFLSSLVSLFFFCWFITGNVWIYSIYEPNYNKTITSVEPYCDKTMYLFAFWTTNVIYILIGLAMLAGCCKGLLCRDN